MSDFKINKNVCYIQNFHRSPNFKAGLSTAPALQEKKEISAGTKVAIGAGVVGVLALAAELIMAKGRHLKSFCHQVKGNKNVEHAFKTVEDAEAYFEKIGIKTVFKDGTEKHLDDLNNIRNGIDILKKNGTEIQKPDVIIFSDWHKKGELKDICRSLNLSDEVSTGISDVLSDNAGMWGTTECIKDGNKHIFINNSFGNMSKFLHEMGHIHQDHGTAYWHSKGLTGSEFRHKQYEFLGLPVPKELAGLNTYKSWSSQCLDDIFRTDCSRGVHVNNDALNQKICSLFPELNGNLETVFFAPAVSADGQIIPYYINAKKIIDKMYSESNVYPSAKNKIFENAAEIFEGLNLGKTYSDDVMLMYDLCGGGRVPNLVIKGKKYDEYIASLYENKDLIQKLKYSLEIKKLV